MAFCQEYVEGRVQPNITYQTLLIAEGGKSGAPSYTFAKESDTGTVFRWKAPDLSAAQYELKFARSTLKWASGTRLILRLRDPNRKAVGFVYRLGQRDPILMQRFTDEYRIENAETLVDGRTSLYIVIVNPFNKRPYTGTTPIELEVTTQGLLPQYDYVTLSLGNVAVRNYIVGGTGAWCGEFSVSNNLYPYGFGDGRELVVKRLTWTGNTFATDPARFVQMTGLSRRTGEIQIRGEVDPVRKQLKSLVARIWRLQECCSNDKSPFTSSTLETVRELELGPVALSEFTKDNTQLSASHNGEEVRTAIRKLRGESKSSDFGKVTEQWTETPGSCTGTPRLSLEFRAVAPKNVIP